MGASVVSHFTILAQILDVEEFCLRAYSLKGPERQEHKNGADARRFFQGVIFCGSAAASPLCGEYLVFGLLISAVAAYERFLKPILFTMDPENVHHFVIAALEIISRYPSLLRILLRSSTEKLEKEVFGLRFPNPIGLAAGFDKNAVALPAWEALGFGFVEVGTITARPQHGNPRPRIFRIPEFEALINRLGFNNEGAAAIGARLELLRDSQRWPKIPVGINIGKTRVVSLEAAAADYLESFRKLKAFGDYFVLNVSSPNTPGLRKLQEGAMICQLFRQVQAENPGKPLLVKIAPDLTFEQIGEILALASEQHLAGVVATNTTVDHQAIPASKRQEGGLSGKPLNAKSLRILRYIRMVSSLPIISVGGIMTAEDAKARFDSGAELIQLYTGFVYRGPGLLRDIVKRL
jgi:dihydroorotate dehydrogenase